MNTQDISDAFLYDYTLSDEERQRLQSLIRKGGEGYSIKYAQILLKLDKRPENIE
jgi:hypothetical protein